MALIKCPACDHNVSTKAPSCPSCGEPLRSTVEIAQGGAINPKDPVHFIVLLVLGFCVLSVIIGIFVEH